MISNHFQQTPIQSTLMLPQQFPVAVQPQQAPNIVINNQNSNQAYSGSSGEGGQQLSIPKWARKFRCPCCGTGVMYRKTRFWIIIILIFVNIVAFPFGLLLLFILFSDRIFYRKCYDCSQYITANF